jgi:AraC family transcriptional regulator
VEPKLSEGRFYGSILRSHDIGGLKLTEAVYPPGAKLPKHSHEKAYFCAVFSGVYSEVYRGKSRTCHPATIIFHPSGELHSDYFYCEGHLLNIEIDSVLAERARDHSGLLETSSAFADPQLFLIAQKLHNEFRHMDEFSSLVIEALALEMLAKASREFRSGSSGKAPLWLSQAREILQAHFCEQLRLEDIANSVGVHPVHLARTFRQHYRCTVGDYVRHLRVEFACRELSTTDAPLVEVATSAGFYSQSHFTTTFKRYVNMTPAQYRKSSRTR